MKIKELLNALKIMNEAWEETKEHFNIQGDLELKIGVIEAKINKSEDREDDKNED